MKLTQEKIETWSAFARLVWQCIFSASVLVAFFVVLSFLIEAKTLFDELKFGAIELFLIGTVYLVFKFYFPATKKDEERPI